MKKKSYVPLNDPAEAFLIFRDELTPELTEVRGEKVYIDLGDYAHLWAHAEMFSRIRWIVETLKNPEEIRRHPNLKLRFWTSFVPEEESYVARMRRGKLLWKPES